MDDLQKSRLIESARSALQSAYAPYSRFRVGAAVLVAGGGIYQGSNVENASYPATICAERVAICKAVSEGSREFEAIAIASDSQQPCSPCGICRQVMAEFAPGMIVLMVGNESVVERTVSELLPISFGLSHLVSE